jgi:diguanylate cyclase (GGDEF)-like protein/PAS domain S-box-containing protein
MMKMDEEQQQYDQEKFKVIFENSPVAIWEEDLSCFQELSQQLKVEGVKNVRKYLQQHPRVALRAFRKIKITDVNKAGLDLYGVSSKTELLKRFATTFTKDDIKVLIDEFIELTSGEKIFEAQFKTRGADGRRYYLWLRVAIPNDFEENLSKAIITIQDISVHKKRESYFKRMAQEDSLTGLLNHRAISNRFEEEFNRSKRYNTPMACAMVDLDYFKPINDNFGHQIGDKMLKQVALFLKKLLRTTDLVGRYGGDEFLLILTGTEKTGALVVAERIRETMSNKHFKLSEKTTIRNTFSIGITSYPANEVKTAREFVQLADKALYQAKADGRNCIHYL